MWIRKLILVHFNFSENLFALNLETFKSEIKL